MDKDTILKTKVIDAFINSVCVGGCQFSVDEAKTCIHRKEGCFMFKEFKSAIDNE